MTPSATWRRLGLAGHDSAQVTPLPDGSRLAGMAAFLSASGPAALAYEVVCGPDWATRRGRVRGFVGPAQVDWRIERGADGWNLNGRAAPGLDDCVDLDFGFTPATNFTQTRRAALAIGGRAEVPAAWIDADTAALAANPELSRIEQVYRRTSERTYAYASPTTGYEAELEMLENGFVRLYPELWQAE